MQLNYNDLLAFFYTPEFQKLHGDMARMDPLARAKFVRDVLIHPEIQATLVTAGHPMTDLPDSFRVPNGSPDPQPAT